MCSVGIRLRRCLRRRVGIRVECRVSIRVECRVSIRVKACRVCEQAGNEVSHQYPSHEGGTHPAEKVWAQG